MVKIKIQMLKVTIVPYSRSYDLDRFAISPCPQIPNLYCYLNSQFLMLKRCTGLHEMKATHLNGFFIKQKLPPLCDTHVLILH